MALVRILVDGYSLLHAWPELAPGKARFSSEAREELIRQLTLYRDASSTPITVFFDGTGHGRGPKQTQSTPEVEILYSRTGQTADDMIERTVHRMLPHGEVLVVTDDGVEREAIIHLGGLTATNSNFIQMIGSATGEVERDIRNYNVREKHQFKRPSNK